MCTRHLQDVHGAGTAVEIIGMLFPKLRHIFADRVYRCNASARSDRRFGKWVIEIVTRSRASDVAGRPSDLVMNERLLGSTLPTVVQRFRETIASAGWVLLASIRGFLGVWPGPETMPLLLSPDSEEARSAVLE